MANGEEFLKDLQTYPILAQEVSLGSAPAASGPSTSLNRTVENLMRDVLGWRPKTSDPRGFVAALTQSFTLEEVEGHVEWSYVPRGYAVQADLGALTGAQASIYQRAKAALAEMLPILDRLYPLQPEYDPENVEAIRTIVHDALVALVAEFGVEGGPLIYRVRMLFEQLLGDNPNLGDPENPGGQLGELRSVFGMFRNAIATIEEERNYTDFLMLVDYTNTFKVSWDAQERYFDRVVTGGDEPYLGTQLVLLSRQLGVIAESVQETYYALDSVFMGPAERQTTELNFPAFVVKAQSDPTLNTWWLALPADTRQHLEDLAQDYASPIFLSELLHWVESAVSETGTKLIQDAGKAGVDALQPMLDNLTDLMTATALMASAPSSNPARGFHTPRSARSLDEVSRGLAKAKSLADQIAFDGFTDNSIREVKQTTLSGFDTVASQLNDVIDVVSRLGTVVTAIGKDFDGRIRTLEQARGDQAADLVLMIAQLNATVESIRDGLTGYGTRLDRLSDDVSRLKRKSGDKGSS